MTLFDDGKALAEIEALLGIDHACALVHRAAAFRKLGRPLPGRPVKRGPYRSYGPARMRGERTTAGILWPSEREALRLAGEGVAMAEAALRLGVTERSVKARLWGARARLSAASTTHAVVLALARGELALGPDGSLMDAYSLTTS